MKTPNDIRVTSWTELIEQLYDGSWNDHLQRYRSNFAFRGLSSDNLELKTSLMRLEGNYYDLEFHILRNFKKYARIQHPSPDTDWSWLAIAKHHGLPTRLLDWTFSPFVAMHFATSNISEYGADGVIWCVDFVKLHNNFLPEILENKLKEKRALCFTVEMLSEVAETLEVFDGLTEDHGADFALFFEPPSMNDRIVNQFALHSVISNPKMTLNDLLDNHPELYRRIIIPSSLKWEVRDKLDQANINERVLFPGLDGLSKWLTRHYTPKK